MSFGQSAGLIKAKFKSLDQAKIVPTTNGGGTGQWLKQGQTLYKCECHGQFFRHLTSLTKHIFTTTSPYELDNAGFSGDKQGSQLSTDPTTCNNIKVKEEFLSDNEDAAGEDEYRVAVDGIVAEVTMTEHEQPSRYANTSSILNVVKREREVSSEQGSAGQEEGILLVDCTRLLPASTILTELPPSEIPESRRKRPRMSPVNFTHLVGVSPQNSSEVPS